MDQKRLRVRPYLLLAASLLASSAALAQGKAAQALPRGDFFAACPFTVVPPAVVVVLDAARWRSVLAAARVSPAPYEAAATDFRRASVFIVALPYSPTSATDASLSSRKPERYDQKTGTLTMFFDVNTTPARAGDIAMNAVGQPCVVTFTAARKDLQQVVMRTADGRYIAGARTSEKPRKKN